MIDAPRVAPQPAFPVVEATVTEGIPLQGVPVMPAQAMAMPLAGFMAPTTLAEQVEVLKSQLGLSGNMHDVIHQAAAQLGVDPGSKPLTEIAKECMQAFGAINEV